MNINGLIEDCMLKLFAYFSCQKLLSLRLVCRRWNELVIITGRSKTSLKLFGTFRDVEEYCKLLVNQNLQHDPYYKLCNNRINDELIGGHDSDLYIPSFAKNSSALKPNCRFLANLFPNIQKLIVYIGASNDEDLGYLLGEWSKTLERLTLGHFGNSSYKSIVAAINSAPSLTRLEVFVSFNSDELSDEVIGQIEHLSLDTVHAFGDEHNHNFNLFPRLLHGKLQHLSFSEGCEEETFGKVINQNGDFASNLTNLNIGPTIQYSFELGVTDDYGIDLATINLACSKFQSLNYLCIMPLVNLNFGAILNLLNQLELLTELRIIYSPKDRFPNLYADLKTVLKSVKVFHLGYSRFMLSNSKAFSMLMPQLFPNLVEMRLIEKCNKNELDKMQRTLDQTIFRLNTSKYIDWISPKDEVEALIGTHLGRYQRHRKQWNKYLMKIGQHPSQQKKRGPLDGYFWIPDGDEKLSNYFINNGINRI